MDNTTYELLAPDVLTAARTTAREWPNLVDQDDAEQEIWVVLLEASQEALDTVAGMDRAQRISTLTTYGHRIGARYREDHELFSGNYFYGTQHVRALLDADALDVADDRPGSLTTTERIDLDIAIERLLKKNPHYVDVIVAQYRYGIPIHSHAQELTRAVDALTLEMNRSHRSGGRSS